MAEISIIIPVYNGINFIEGCLDSITLQTYKEFEIIVVDNGSTDNTPFLIEENYSRVRVVKNKKNLGTCKARNQAIEITQGKWVLSLDCDIILEKNFLAKIIMFANKSEESIGMFQPKILKSDKKMIYSCGIYLSKLRRFYDIGWGKFDNGESNDSEYIFGVCSAAALYKREMLEDIKQDGQYFDEDFFFLVEDVDVAWRAQRNGWRAISFPDAVCYHYGDSSGFGKQYRQYLSFRNRYFLILKNEDARGVVKIILLLIIYDIPRLFYLLFVNKYTLKALREVKDKISRLGKEVREWYVC